MACQDCNNTTPISLTGTFFPGSPCTENTDCNGASMNANCVYYNGPNLSCSGVNTLDSLELSLQKFDEKLCAVIGDYSTYNMHCLPDWYGQTIDTQEKFVDAITGYACEIVSTLETFTGVTFPAFQEDIQGQVDALDVPGITCATASVTSSDNLVTVLSKYCSKMTSLTTGIDISSVDWNQCFTVVSPPTTIAQGFDLLIDQICDVLALAEGGSLPTFNNYSSCIGGGSNDSLITTIGLIKTRLCLTPTWDADNVSWGCIGAPTDDVDLEEAIQRIVDSVNTNLQALPTFDSGDFTTTATDPMDPCAGVTISLVTPINSDRFVATDVSDTSPGTLIDKLVQGTGITLDFVSSPGLLIISASNAISIADTNSVNLGGNGTSGTPLTADVKISAVSGNLVSIVSDGLFVGGSTLVNNGLNYDSGAARVQLGGALVEDTTIGSGDFQLSISRVAVLNNASKIADTSVLTLNGTATSEANQYLYAAKAGTAYFTHTGAKSLNVAGIYTGLSGSIAFESNFALTGGILSSMNTSSTFSGTGNITSFANLRILYPKQAFGAPAYTGTLTNCYGVYIENTATSDIYSQITNKFGIYQVGTGDKNFFGGVIESGSTSHWLVPVGSNGQRPIPVAGMIRFNTTTSKFEGYDGTAWVDLS